MTKTLGDLLKDVKKSIIDEVDKKDPVVSLDKNEDGLVVTKSSGEQFTIDLSHFNADMANIAQGEKGETGERGERGLTVKGDRGEAGRAGNSIIDVKFDQRGHLIITTDDKKYDLGLLRSGGGTTIIKQGGGEGGGDVNLTGDISGTTDANGLTNTTLQPSDNVFDIISQAPTYAYPEFTEFYIDFPADKYEIGESIPSTLYTLDFATINTENIRDEIYILKDLQEDLIYPDGITESNKDFGLFNSPTLNSPGYYQFELSNYNSKGEVFNNIFSVSFVDKYYYGESDQDTIFPPPSSSFNSQLAEVEKPEYIDFSFDAGVGLYKWIYIPERFGDEYIFEDPVTGIQFLMEQAGDVTFGNIHGISTTYKAYRSVNRIAGEIKLRIF